jgi:hypothetical protein
MNGVTAMLISAVPDARLFVRVVGAREDGVNFRSLLDKVCNFWVGLVGGDALVEGGLEWLEGELVDVIGRGMFGEGDEGVNGLFAKRFCRNVGGLGVVREGGFGGVVEGFVGRHPELGDEGEQ